MKNLLFSLTLFFSLSVYGQWIELDPGIEVSYFSDVYALSTDVAIVVGADGTILKTTDGGETWEQKSSGTNYDVHKVYFPTSEIGYCTSFGNILKTIDGGENWFLIGSELDCFCNNFSCVNENLIFIICSGYLMKSNDGGETWSDLGGLSLTNIQFLNDDIGYAGNEYGDFSKTEDGGQTWQELANEIFPPFKFIDDNIGFYYVEGLYKTMDGGLTFDLVRPGAWFDLVDIDVVNEEQVWGILSGVLDGDPSSRGISKISLNETVTESVYWENNPDIDMLSISFANEDTGYVVGIKNGIGAIWKNSTGINEGLNVNEVEQVMKINIYPNPVSTELNVDLSNSLSSNATISIFNVSGQQIYLKSFNQKNIKINTSQFQKGVYILQVKTEQQNYSEKILIN